MWATDRLIFYAMLKKIGHWILTEVYSDYDVYILTLKVGYEFILAYITLQYNFWNPYRQFAYNCTTILLT